MRSDQSEYMWDLFYKLKYIDYMIYENENIIMHYYMQLNYINLIIENNNRP